MADWRKTKESDRYEVSDEGEVRGPRGRVLKPTLMQIGYYSIAISLGNHKVIRRYIHRLVAEAFLGDVPDGHVINHINSNKLDNTRANLEIVSRKENASHWAKKNRSDVAKPKSTGFCARGHRLHTTKKGHTYCQECKRLNRAGHRFAPPTDTEWRESMVEGYLVSSDGRLWSDKTNRLMKGGINKPGYHYQILRLNGESKPFAMHRLVADAFIRPIKSGEVVDHLDGDKLNNTVANLSITTRSKNTIAFQDRVRRSGNHGYKLTDKDVREIKEALADGQLTQKDIAYIFGISQSLVSAIKVKRKWKHIE